MSSVNAWDPITEEAVLQALELILNPSNYPMMIMCNLGRHRTGKKKTKEIEAKCNVFLKKRNDCWLYEETTKVEFNVYI